MQTAKPEPEHFAKSIYDGITFFSRGRFIGGFRRLIRVAFAVLGIM
jgi:hypothetical protein